MKRFWRGVKRHGRRKRDMERSSQVDKVKLRWGRILNKKCENIRTDVRLRIIIPAKVGIRKELKLPECQ